jgi:hypothetical protein
VGIDLQNAFQVLIGFVVGEGCVGGVLNGVAKLILVIKGVGVEGWQTLKATMFGFGLSTATKLLLITIIYFATTYRRYLAEKGWAIMGPTEGELFNLSRRIGNMQFPFGLHSCHRQTQS